MLKIFNILKELPLPVVVGGVIVAGACLGGVVWYALYGNH